MNAYELFEAMDGIDDDILERSEIKRKSPMRFIRPSLIAACCVLVLSALYAQLRFGILHPMPQVDPTSTQETTEDLREVVNEPYYNDAGYWWMEGYGRNFYTTHELTEREILPMLPEKTAEWMSFTGEAMVLEDGSTYRVFLNTPSRVVDANIQIVFGKYSSGYHVDDNAEAVVYLCGTTKYVLGLVEESMITDRCVLIANGTVHGVPVYLEMQVPLEEIEAAKADFEEALVCFDSYPKNMPDLRKVSVSQEPYAWYMPFTREQIEEHPYYAMLLPEKKITVYAKMEITWDRWESGFNWILIDCYRYGKEQAMTWGIQYWEGTEGSGSFLCNIDEVIDAKDLTLEMVEQLVAQSKVYSAGSVYYNTYYIRFNDNLMISITIEDVSAQWLHDQLIAVRERVESAG